MFNVANFIASLDIMLKGMVGIFAVLGLILLVTLLFGKIFKD